MTMRKLLMTLILAGLSLATARIGTEAAPILDDLTADATVVAAQEFSFEPVVYDGLLFSLSGQAGESEADLAAVGAAVGHATGFGEQIAVPVTDFLRANLAELAELGQASVPVEGNYLLELTLSETDDGGLQVGWSFGLAELDPELFLPVRYALGADPDAARIVIREFADLQCPHCSNFTLNVLPELRQLLDADDSLRFEFHHMPLVTIHANAIPAAEALECVAAVNGADSFFGFSETIFERMQAWAALPETGPYFISLAEEQGFDTTGVSECLAEREHLGYIRASYDNAVQQLGVSGTPTVFVDGIRVGRWNEAAAYEELIRLLDARSATP